MSKQTQASAISAESFSYLPDRCNFFTPPAQQSFDRLRKKSFYCQGAWNLGESQEIIGARGGDWRRYCRMLISLSFDL